MAFNPILIYLVGFVCTLVVGGLYIRAKRWWMVKSNARGTPTKSELDNMTTSLAYDTTAYSVLWPMTWAVLIILFFSEVLIPGVAILVGGGSLRDFFSDLTTK